MGGDEGAKYIHCVEEACQEGAGGGGGNDSAAGGVVIEWARRPAVGSGGHLCAGGDVQEVLVKCRVGRFPSRKSFYLLVSHGRSRLVFRGGGGRGGDRKCWVGGSKQQEALVLCGWNISVIFAILYRVMYQL